MEEKGAELQRLRTPKLQRLLKLDLQLFPQVLLPYSVWRLIGYYLMEPMPMYFQFNASPLIMNQTRLVVILNEITFHSQKYEQMQVARFQQ